MLRREGNTYIVTDRTGRETRTTNLVKALKSDHFVNLSDLKYDKDNKATLKEVRESTREMKKMYEKKRLNDN